MSINTSSPTVYTSSVLIGDVTNTTSQGGDPTMTTAGSPVKPVSACLELQSTNGALLLPRITNTSMTGLNVVNGMVVYNSTFNSLYAYQNGAWGPLITGGAPSTSDYILKTADASLPNSQSLGLLTTGLLKNTVAASVGTLSTATHGVDYYAPGYPTTIIDTGDGGNFFIGSFAGESIAGGVNNMGGGDSSLNALTTGSYNSAYGPSSLEFLVTGSSNSAFGFEALGNNLNSYNSAFGVQSSAAGISSTRNSSFGFQSLTSNLSGSDNCSVGYQSGYIQTIYNECNFFGSGADATSNNLTNATAIGYNTKVAISNALILGNGANVGIGTSSPLQPLHIVGTFQQKGITSGWTGTDNIRGQAAIQTSDASGPFIFTLLTENTPPTTYTIIGTLTAVDSTGASVAVSNQFIANVYNNAGTAVFLENPTITFTNTGAFTVAAAFGIVSQTLHLAVVGLLGVTIQWVFNYEYYAVTNTTA